MLQMHDMIATEPNHECLFRVASEQMGFFTNRQAALCGFSRDGLAKHAKSGRFIRERQGLYRLRDYPSGMFEEIMAAWLTVGRDIAVVSHQSALEVLNLSDVIADAVHLTVSRAKRSHPRIPGVRIHTTTRGYEPSDVIVREGMRVTSPVRTVIDVDDIGLSLEHVEVAAREAIAYGQATKAMFVERAERRGGRFHDHLARGVVVL